MEKQAPAGHEFELFMQMKPKLYRYAVGVLGNPHDAEDALQEASLKVWRHTGQLADFSSLSAWLYRVVVNTCRDHLRKTSRRPQTQPLGNHTPFTHDRHWIEFEAMLSHLSERQKEIAILRFGLDLTFKEIASVTQMPESTVKYQLVKAVEELRSVYNPQKEVGCDELR